MPTLDGPFWANRLKLPDGAATSADFEAAYDGFDWDCADIAALREDLRRLEKREGVTKAHQLASQALAARARLFNPDPFPRELSACALSPDGRHLAVGSWHGEDCDNGSPVQLWDMATGSCVNIIDGIEYGLGSYVCERAIQWSRDSRWLAMEYNGSQIGTWDPFSGTHEPVGKCHGGALAGDPKPVGFSLSPTGDRVFVHSGDAAWRHGPSASDASGIHGGLETPAPGYQLPEPTYLEPPPAEIAAQLASQTVEPDCTVFASDGRRLWGYGETSETAGEVGGQGMLFAVDLDQLHLTWVRASDRHQRGERNRWWISLSPDETLLAHHCDEKLQFIDPTTGLLIAEYPALPGAVRLEWTGRRLAEIGAAVRIYDGTQYRCDLDVQLLPWGENSLSDALPWSWAPDGHRAACLTADGQIQVWDLTDEPALVSTTAAPARASGVFFGASEVVATIGTTRLRFTTVEGDLLRDHSFHCQADAPLPLSDGDTDYGEYLDQRPTFALDAAAWAVAFDNGVVIAPPGRQGDLEDKLAWSIDQRYGWPLRWHTPRVVPDVEQALPYLDEDTQDELAVLAD